MSGSDLLQHIARDVVFATKKVRSRTANANVLGTAVFETRGKVLGRSSRGCDELSVPG